MKKNVKIRKESLLQPADGITLVALVITIVLIMILSTVTINTIFGENGLIKQAENAKIWQPWLCFLAISILKWSFPEIASLLQGKKEFSEEDIQPSELNINKLFRYERQIGEGHYSSVWIVENKKDHIFYALKKVDVWNLSKYEKLALSVGSSSWNYFIRE